MYVYFVAYSNVADSRVALLSQLYSSLFLIIEISWTIREK